MQKTLRDGTIARRSPLEAVRENGKTPFGSFWGCGALEGSAWDPSSDVHSPMAGTGPELKGQQVLFQCVDFKERPGIFLIKLL
jgi:hypothetical protein